MKRFYIMKYVSVILDGHHWSLPSTFDIQLVAESRANARFPALDYRGNKVSYCLTQMANNPMHLPTDYTSRPRARDLVRVNELPAA